jgi:hypothetical protein
VWRPVDDPGGELLADRRRDRAQRRLAQDRQLPLDVGDGAPEDVAVEAERAHVDVRLARLDVDGQRVVLEHAPEQAAVPRPHVDRGVSDPHHRPVAVGDPAALDDHAGRRGVPPHASAAVRGRAGVAPGHRGRVEVEVVADPQDGLDALAVQRRPAAAPSGCRSGPGRAARRSPR